MVGPGDETAGRGRYSYLRASHADRERVIDVLKAAFVQGRLAKDEFDRRVGRVLASRTYADLNVLIADMPAGLASSQPPEPARASGTRSLANRMKGRSSRRGPARPWRCRAWRSAWRCWSPEPLSPWSRSPWPCSRASWPFRSAGS